MRHLKLIRIRLAFHPLETWLAIFTLAFAVPVMINDQFSRSASFRIMSQYGTGLAWGMVFCALSLHQVMALSLDDYRQRRINLFCGAVLWGGVFWLFFLSGDYGPSLYTFAVRTAAYLWTLRQARR